MILWASPVRGLLTLPGQAPDDGAGTATPLRDAAAAAVRAERDQPVGG